MRCSKCSREASPGRRQCAVCLRRAAEWAAKDRARRAGAGLCQRAGCGRPPEPGRVRCHEHLTHLAAIRRKPGSEPREPRLPEYRFALEIGTRSYANREDAVNTYRPRVKRAKGSGQWVVCLAPFCKPHKFYRPNDDPAVRFCNAGRQRAHELRVSPRCEEPMRVAVEG